MKAPTPAEAARRDAQRLAHVIRDVGGDGEELAGGWMACDVPGSWVHYAAGLGIERPLEAADVKRLIEFYTAHDRHAEVQATPYQDESVFSQLAAHDFHLDSFETVLTRGLGEPLPQQLMPDINFVEVDPEDEVATQRFIDVHLNGFYPNGDAPDGMRPIAERVVRHARVTLWVIEQGGRAIGSGGVEVHENSAVLIAGSVFPEHRGQGIQTALFHHRMKHAAERGFEYAIVGSTPGGPTERNALRLGFAPAYTQLSLVRKLSK